MHGIHAATSKVENLAQGSSCKLKFVHGSTLDYAWLGLRRENLKLIKILNVLRSFVGVFNLIFEISFLIYAVKNFLLTY